MKGCLFLNSNRKRKVYVAAYVKTAIPTASCISKFCIMSKIGTRNTPPPIPNNYL